MKETTTEKNELCRQYSKKYKSWDHQVVAGDSWWQGFRICQESIYEEITKFGQKYALSLEAFSELSDIVALAKEGRIEVEYKQGEHQLGERSTDGSKVTCTNCFQLK